VVHVGGTCWWRYGPDVGGSGYGKLGLLSIGPKLFYPVQLQNPNLITIRSIRGHQVISSRLTPYWETQIKKNELSPLDNEGTSQPPLKKSSLTFTPPHYFSKGLR
jgi:hypothetical protein